MKRIEYFDTLKCVAVFFVILYHSMTLPDSAGHVWNWSFYLMSILSVCIPLFFMVNGALLLGRSLNINSHIRKTTKLFVLYIFWDVWNVTVNMFMKGTILPPAEFAGKLLILESGWNDHIWFLAALFSVYVLFPLFKCVYDNRPEWFKLTAAIVFFLTFAGSTLQMLSDIIKYTWGVNYIYGFIILLNNFAPLKTNYCYTFCYFLLGSYLLSRPERVFSRRSRLLAAAALPVLMLFSTVYGMFMTRAEGITYDVVWYGYDSIFTFGAVCAFCVLLKGQTCRLDIVRNIVRQISERSLGIYLLHSTVLAVSLPHIRASAVYKGFAATFLYALAVLFICLGITGLISKVPYINRTVRL